MIGGTAYVAGKSAVHNQEREQDQQDRIAALEQQQYAAPAPAPAAPAAPAQSDVTSKLLELKGLVDQGVLTEEEFAAAKQKLLAG